MIAVTGAASGIGRAVAHRLAAEGLSIALIDRDAGGLAETIASMRPSAATRVDAHHVDVTDRTGLAAALAQSASSGPLDGLVSVAGVIEPARLADVTDESWRRHFEINSTGVLHLLQEGTPLMRDGGSVVVVGSNAARVPRIGMLAYAASKAATTALTRCAGLELAERGIRCNVVEPGSTDTPMQRDLWPDAAVGERTAIGGDPAAFRVGIPLRRIGAADDVAGLVCFLLSDAARQMTLQCIGVDGGASL